MARLLCALLLAGCGSAASAPRCELRGVYELTVQGCGSTFTYTTSYDWSAACVEGDVCDAAVPATFCSFQSSTGVVGCPITTSVKLVQP